MKFIEASNWARDFLQIIEFMEISLKRGEGLYLGMRRRQG